jgi:hypothetical protein
VITPQCFEGFDDLDADAEWDSSDEAFFDCGCERDAAVVGLRCATRDQRICTFGQCIAHQKFKLACLVATGREPQHIVAFNPNLRAAECAREIR